MAAPRLTNPLRQSILSDVIKHAFHDKFAAMIADEIQLSHDIFDHIFKNDLELLANAKPHLFPRQTNYRLMANNEHHRMSFSGPSFNIYSLYHLPLSYKTLDKAERPIPFSVYSDRPTTQLDATSKMGRRLMKAEARNDQFIQTVRSAVTSANAILHSTASFSKLIDAWPEIESFAKPYMNQGSSNLPAVQTTALNAMLDIPV